MGEWKIVVPQAAENLWKNGEFHSSVTTAWVATGGATWSFNDTDIRPLFGRYCYKHSLTNGNQRITQNVSTTIGQYYTIVAHFYGSNLTSSDVNVYREGNAAWQTMEEVAENWWRCTYTFQAVYTVYAAGVTIVDGDAKQIYVDGLSLVHSTEASTFLGWMMDGCYNETTKYDSRVFRSGQHRGGGVIYDLKDDFNFAVTSAQGLGMQQPHFTIDEYGTISGGQLNQLGSGVRQVTIMGNFATSTLHADRKALIEALKPNAYPDLNGQPQPVMFIYTGTLPWRIFYGTVVSGLEGNWTVESLNLKTTESIVLRVLMTDPNVYGYGKPAIELDSQDTNTVSIDGLAFRDMDGTWTFPTTSWDKAGTYSGVRKIFKASNGVYYILHNSTDLDGYTGWDYVSMYDANMTVPILKPPGGMAATFNASVIDVVEDTEGYIWFTGSFTAVGGVTARYAVRYDYDNDQFTCPLTSSGFNAMVQSACPAPQGGIYFVGDFTDLFGASSNTYLRVAYWDGSSFSALESGATANGFNNTCSSVFSGRNDGLIYFGGQFTAAGNSVNTDCSGVTAYDPASDLFVDMNGGCTGGTISASIMFVKENGDVWISTMTTYAGGVTCLGNLMIWNGLQFENGGQGGMWAKDWAQGPDGMEYYPGSSNGWSSSWHPYILPSYGGQGWCRKGNVYRNQPIFAQSDFTSGDDKTIEIGHVDPGNPRRYEIWFGTDHGDDDGNLKFYIPGSTDVVYNGNTPAYPTVRLEGNATASVQLMHLRNCYTGAQIDFDYLIQPGEILTIVFAPDKASVTSSLFGEVNWAILPASDWVDFTLVKGTNPIHLFTMPSPLADCSIWFDELYDGID